MYYGVRLKDNEWSIVRIQDYPAPMPGVKWIEVKDSEITVPKVALIDDEITIVEDDTKVKLKQIKEKYIEMDTGIADYAAGIFGTSNRESMLAFAMDFQLRVLRPDLFVNEGDIAKMDIGSFTAGDSLDTEQKIKDYYSDVLYDLLVTRRQKIADYLTFKAGLGM